MILNERVRYEIHPERVMQSIQNLLHNCEPNRLFIRFAGSSGGGRLVDELLAGRTLSIKEEKQVRVFTIDDQVVFDKFTINEPWEKRVSLDLTQNFGKEDWPLEPCLRGANMHYYFEVYFSQKDIKLERFGEFWEVG